MKKNHRDPAAVSTDVEDVLPHQKAREKLELEEALARVLSGALKEWKLRHPNRVDCLDDFDAVLRMALDEFVVPRFSQPRDTQIKMRLKSLGPLDGL
jgi:citrate lyase beta subunit